MPPSTSLFVHSSVKCPPASLLSPAPGPTFKTKLASQFFTLQLSCFTCAPSPYAPPTESPRSDSIQVNNPVGSARPIPLHPDPRPLKAHPWLLVLELQSPYLGPSSAPHHRCSRSREGLESGEGKLAASECLWAPPLGTNFIGNTTLWAFIFQFCAECFGTEAWGGVGV